MEVSPFIIVVVVCIAVAIVAVPYLWSLLALRSNPASAKGAYQQKAVAKLLSLKDSLEAKGHSSAAHLCRDSIIALICEGEEAPAKPKPEGSKSLFQ